MEILHFKAFGGYKSVINECSLGVNLVIDNFVYVATDSSSLYKIWKQSDHYLSYYGDIAFEDLGDTECRSAVNAVVLVLREINFNSNVPQGGIYPHIKFERDASIFFELER